MLKALNVCHLSVLAKSARLRWSKMATDTMKEHWKMVFELIAILNNLPALCTSHHQ